MKGVPGRSIQHPAFVPPFAAALDALMPATAAVALPPEYTVVIFEFADHYVSRAYVAAAETLTVAAPEDALTVHATPALVQLMASLR